MLALWKESSTNPDSILKSRDIILPTKLCIVKAMVFLVVMCACESWTIKKAECWRIDAFKLWCWRRLLSLLDSKEIKPVNSKGNKPWIFIGGTEAEAPILWPTDAKSRLIRKDPDAWKELRQEEKGMIEYEMVGWHHWLNVHESEQTVGDTEGQGGLACCSLWARRKLDMTERLNNNNNKFLPWIVHDHFLKRFS